MIFEELMCSSGHWQQNFKSTALKSTKDIIFDYLVWIYRETRTNFTKEYFELFKEKLEKLKQQKKSSWGRAVFHKLIS
jgi:hypothetical protein